LAPKAKEENGRGNAGKKTVKLLQNGLQNPARRSIITWLKKQNFSKNGGEASRMNSDSSDHPKPRFSCDVDMASVSAAS
jgi:hypothetical protein